MPPLASRAHASRRLVICEAVSRLSLSAARRGDTRKLVKLPVNDSSNRLTTARASGAVASSITTFRGRLSVLVTKSAVMFGNSATPPARWSWPCSLGPAYFPRSNQSVKVPLPTRLARSLSAPAGQTAPGRVHGSTWM